MKNVGEKLGGNVVSENGYKYREKAA